MQQLMDLGFDWKQAEMAACTAGGNASAAAELLFEGVYWNQDPVIEAASNRIAFKFLLSPSRCILWAWDG